MSLRVHIEASGQVKPIPNGLNEETTNDMHSGWWYHLPRLLDYGTEPLDQRSCSGVDRNVTLPAR
jgi:hypothetical protein